MKLYYYPGTCSMAPHIVLHELGLPHESELVDLRAGQGQSPEYRAINPIGAVPVLELQPGVRLTEVQAILQYLGDQQPEAGLIPNGLNRYRMLEWLSFIATELHRNHYPVFFAARCVSGEDAQKELADFFRKRLADRWKVVSDRLEGHDYCLASGYSVADPYLYTVMTWSKLLQIELDERLLAYMARMEQRPAVAAVLEKEKPQASLPK